MSTEFGLFNDEGLVENGFYSPEAAREALDTRYSGDDELEIEEICPDHPEQPRCGCEECDSEETADEFYADLEDDEEED
jgi:hypothetical protein